MSMIEKPREVERHIDRLIEEGFKISAPMSQLLLIRRKISARGLKSFDKADIENELDGLQSLLTEMQTWMGRLNKTLLSTEIERKRGFGI